MVFGRAIEGVVRMSNALRTGDSLPPLAAHSACTEVSGGLDMARANRGGGSANARFQRLSYQAIPKKCTGMTEIGQVGCFLAFNSKF